MQTASFAGWFLVPQGAEPALPIGFDPLDQTTGRRIILLGNALALG